MPTLRPPVESKSRRRSTRPDANARPLAVPTELTVELLDAELVSSGMKQLVRAVHGLVETRLARAEARLLARVEEVVARRLDAFLRDLLAAIMASGVDPRRVLRAALDAKLGVCPKERTTPKDGA